jgi:hypothetical protein
VCLQPFAYGLREHQVFQQPNRIPTDETILVQKPRAWKQYIRSDGIEVLPLVDDLETRWATGWSAESTGFDELPEVEVMCGAMNTKRPTAGAVWRQGNLLHFNFAQDPSQLNEVGRNLLENSIRYISRFTQDRPIAVTRSVRTGAKPIPVRGWLAKSFMPQLDPERVPSYFNEKECSFLEENGTDAFRQRFDVMRGHYFPDEKGKLGIDADLLLWEVENDHPAMIARCIEGLAGGDGEAKRGRRLLDRYVPCGPGESASAEEWLEWFKEHRTFIFFTDIGGYRWYVDPLAKARGVPTEELRGPARADAHR